MKNFGYFLTLGALILFIGLGQIRVSAQEAVPAVASVDFVLAEIPGVLDKTSKWEIGYELRLTNEAGKYAAIRAGKLKQMQDEERVGDLVYKGSYTGKSLFLPENRRVSVKIPLSEEIRNKLQAEPWDRIDLSGVKIDENVAKQSREQASRAQVFLLYATALIYDGKTKKTTVVPINRVLSFREYTTLDFFYTLTVTEEGYKLDAAMPKGPVKVVSKRS